MRLQSTCLCVGLARNASVSDSDLITEKGVAVLPHLTEVLSYSGGMSNFFILVCKACQKRLCS